MRQTCGSGTGGATPGWHLVGRLVGNAAVDSGSPIVVATGPEGGAPQVVVGSVRSSRRRARRARSTPAGRVAGRRVISRVSGEVRLAVDRDAAQEQPVQRGTDPEQARGLGGRRHRNRPRESASGRGLLDEVVLAKPAGRRAVGPAAVERHRLPDTQREKCSWTAIAFAASTTERVVPTPNGRGEVQQVREPLD
jgi:hypothetical protein